ncbi:MAG: DUF3667 domain-containing protein [Bacteroidales bacterium]|nr:DUF3667 domain-containing protein [Bacteroidales bacterium]
MKKKETPDENKTIHCLNCGTEFKGNFCPECGQRSSVKRLTFGHICKEAAWNVLRMDSRVFPTIWFLITKPWKVISEYIHGKRIRYTPPVRLITILCLVGAALEAIPGLDGNQLMVKFNDHEDIFGKVGAAIADFVMNSQVFQTIIIGIPTIIILYLVYLPFGSRKFNIAEYVYTYFYMMASSTIINILMLPLRLIKENLDMYVSFAWIAVLSLILLFKAFRFKSFGVRVLMVFVAGFAFLMFIFLLAFIFYKFGKVDLFQIN